MDKDKFFEIIDQSQKAALLLGIVAGHLSRMGVDGKGSGEEITIKVKELAVYIGEKINEIYYRMERPE